MSRRPDSETVSTPARLENLSVDFLHGGGQMGALMRATDWSKTPFGAVETWSPSLRMIVRFLLPNGFAKLLWWGPDYLSIYNDAYAPVLGKKHPDALGKPFREVWPEIEHILKPLIDRPFQGGPATWIEDIELEINRHGFLEETHFTVAYSPVPDDTVATGIGGVLATVHEITGKVVGERRVLALRDLGARSAESRTAKAACAVAADVLAGHAKDVPFALLYLLDADNRRASLAGAAGIATGELISPRLIEIGHGNGAGSGWPFADVVRSEAMVVVEDVQRCFGHQSAPLFGEAGSRAVVVPIRSNKPHHLAGILVAGVSSKLRLDDLYRGFFELMATQISTAIANALAYEEERQRAEVLAEIDRTKTAFFSNVSHEFRTPLTLMLAPLDDVLNDPAPSALTADQRKQLEVVHRNSMRLLRLVNTLLDFSRIEAGRIQASYHQTDLSAMTADVASGFRSTIERAGMTLEIDCPPLPVPVHVDGDMWEKIILNLLSNAFKFTFEGGVTVSQRAENGHAVLRVRDTGVGVPDTELPRLFERFHRIEGQRSRSFEGSGIGLALVSELVKLHGGTIEAHSTVGKGTEFVVSIPFGTAHLPKDRLDAAPPSLPTATRVEAFVEEALRWLPDIAEAASDFPMPPSITAPAAVGHRYHVLLADDNADMRDYVRRLLGQHYEITAVADGEEALAVLRRRRPDLLLTDAMMPRLDGFGLLWNVRNDPALRDMPVIILSARAGDEARIEGLAAGADDYLIKPFSARELLARVDSNLRLARARSDALGELRTSEERFRALVGATSDVIYRMNADWTEMRQLVGRDFIVDTNDPSRIWLERYIHPDDEVKVKDAIAEAIRSKTIFELEHRVLRVDGSLGWVLSRAVPLLGADGEITEWFGAASDVTEQRRVAQELQALNENLEAQVEERTRDLAASEEALRQSQKMEAVGQLTGGLAHDFNNILAGISGSLDLMQNRVTQGRFADIERYLNAAHGGVKRAAALTQRLLAFSRRQTLDPKPLNINRLVAGMEDLIRRSVGPAISIESVAAAGLWSAFVDAGQLENALLNLCLNARDAMVGGGKLTIETANRWLDDRAARDRELPPGQYVSLCVSDNGTGMSPDIVARAFDPFFTTKPIGQGTGLGLSMIYGFARQSGGHAKIYSEVGKGTMVCIYLPRHLGEAEAPEAEAERAQMPRTAGGQVVLVVDDEPLVRMFATEVLEELGYASLEASDGIAGMKILNSGTQVDLLISDVGLPNGMNGRQFADAARELRPGLKVLFITGYAENALLNHGHLEHGMHVMTKPFTMDALAKRIRDLLGVP